MPRGTSPCEDAGHRQDSHRGLLALELVDRTDRNLVQATAWRLSLIMATWALYGATTSTSLAVSDREPCAVVQI